MRTLLSLFLLVSTAHFIHAQERCIADSLLAPFYHGVASGDPSDSSVLLWTRITIPDEPFPVVDWEVATDTNFTDVVVSGTTTTDAEQDFCIHVMAYGLEPYHTYYYRFAHEGFYSLTGRTRTLPDGDIDSLRFAVVSCASLNAGYFNVYEIITERNDFDGVIFLGDYIYEYGSTEYGYNPAADRAYQPDDEIIDLSDYRTRHAQYKLDQQLRYLHQNFAFICLWDDHEFADNSWNYGAVNHQPAAEGDWLTRVAAAEDAYFDWMPVTRNQDTIFPYSSYRAFQLGDLMDLWVLDTRIDDRTKQVDYFDFDWDDPTRHIFSLEQREWLFDGLKNSTAQWKVIGQQVMMSPLEALGVPVNDDQWDGYPKDQEAVLGFLRDSIPNNKVVLTGDIHSSWANDIATPSYSPGGPGSAGVEFVGPSVTSPSEELGWAEETIMFMNEHIKFVDIEHRGWLMLDVNKNRVQGDYYFINNIDSYDSLYNYDDGWYCLDGNNVLYHADTAAVRAPNRIVPLAPGCPAAPDTATVSLFTQDAIILGIYPNPASQYITLQYSLQDDYTLTCSIYDQTQRKVLSQSLDGQTGLHQIRIPITQLSAGTYILQLETRNGVYRKQFVVG